MADRGRPPSPTWCSFLINHADCLASVDLFVVPTVTFRLLYGFVVLCHERRRVAHFNVTTHPTAEWIARQIKEDFPFDKAPRYLIRDRDAAYGGRFRECLERMGVDEVLTAPRSPWQSSYVERLIGSIRRERLDHVIVFDGAHFKRVLGSYFSYYHTARTHRSLDDNVPRPRVVEPPGRGGSSPSLKWAGCTAATPGRLRAVAIPTTAGPRFRDDEDPREGMNTASAPLFPIRNKLDCRRPHVHFRAPTRRSRMPFGSIRTADEGFGTHTG